MPDRAGRSRIVIACVWGVLAIGGPTPTPLLLASARADADTVEPDTIASRSPERGPFVLPSRTAARGRTVGDSSRWWVGTAGVALALALFGAGSLAARRLLPRAVDGPLLLRVVGRASLSPRHSVALLRAGDRILIVGTGPQGPPALLGEWTDPAPTIPDLDVRIGDDR